MSFALPHAPRDALRLGVVDTIVFDGLCALAARLGVWRYPARASGDVEHMRLLDKVYWVYKGSRPIRHAEKGSGLERWFARQTEIRDAPAGFEPNAHVRLSAVGDLMNHPYLERSTSMYRDVEDAIFGADVSMANLECVVVDESVPLEISARSRSGPALTMSRQAFTTVASRYTFLATASNHSIDLGRPGVESTIAAIRDAGIAFHGTNEQRDHATHATLIERNGVMLGVVSHTFGVNGHAKPAPWIVNHTRLNHAVGDIDFGLLEEQLADSRRRGADFVIAQLHWGMEFELYPRTTQVAVARHIAELGADAIVGHHPHILQPFENYRVRRDPDRTVPIFYSLGNLTTPFGIDYTRRSGVARLELAKGRARDGTTKTYVVRSCVELVEQDLDGAELRLRLRNDIDVFGRQRGYDVDHVRT